MSEHESFERLCALISEFFGTSPENIHPETQFINDLGADSLGIVELMMAIEESFDIDIPDGLVSQIHTVADALALVKKQVLVS